LNKRNLLEISGILLLTLVIGVLHNISSPNRIHFIGREQAVDFSQSDSLMTELKKQDSLQRVADSLKNNSNKREDSIRAANEKRIQDSLKTVKFDSVKHVQDSVKHVQDSIKTAKSKLADSVKSNPNTQNFVKPIDIKLDFAKALFDKKYRFIDARDISDYNAGHIQGAMNIAYHQIEKYQSVLDGLPRDQVYVCYCSSACDVSIDLAYAMAHMGFTKTYIFHGGWDEWKTAGYPAN
jgi:rhodanese-related sulfurtransferase